MSAPRILIVDDDEMVRITLEAALDSYGPVGVGSASEALELLSSEDFDLVLCDLMMPGVTGAELYEALPEDSPLRSRFLFMSGGALPGAMQDFLRERGPAILRKPFSIDQVREAVMAHLGER